MHDGLHPKRLRRLPRVRLLALATIMSEVLVVAGCGGSSHRPTAASRGGVTAATTTAVATGPGSTTAVATGAASSGTAASGAALYCGQDPCFSPQQFRVAYGIQPLLDRGIDGRGETVTVLVPVPLADEGPTDIRRDLESFDSMFGLPAARIEVVSSLVRSASPWRATDEEVGDTEFVHAVAPAATLRVVLFPSNWGAGPANATADMLAGLRLVVSHTDVASISWSLGEHYFTKAQVAEMHSILREAAAHHVTVIGSSGNGGSFPTDRGWGKQVKGVSLPASDPLVLGAGGTTLTANRKTGAYIRETAWSDSGGGFSHLNARPAYQKSVPRISQARGVPDVAGDADEAYGMARVDSQAGTRSLWAAAGTSNSAPLWGGLVALADQYAHRDLGFVNPTIYAIGRSSSYHKAFHDITNGYNGYPASAGWDPVTGWGTPNATVLIGLLARLTNRSKT